MSELNFFTANAGLADVAKLEVPEMSLLYRIEMAGELFYNILADRVGNDTAADLLRKNAVEERGHARRLARMISIKLGHEWEPTPEEAELLAVPLPETIDSKMFAAVVQGEINGDAGYQRWADAETDEEVVRLLRLNGREETIHAGRAQQVFDLLNA
ncbi:MAG: ferritin-like domain-containing protein [Ilumatobacteraceae bacterium]|jgi:rubrerythrin